MLLAREVIIGDITTLPVDAGGRCPVRAAALATALGRTG